MTPVAQNNINQASNNLREIATKSQGKDGKLNKNDFLNLFMVQMGNQDPLDPMDSSKMMSQISQMGSMEQLQNLNTKFEAFTHQQANSQKIQSLQFLGTKVAYKDDKIAVEKGKVPDLKFELSDNSSVTTAKIVSNTGSPIKEIRLGGLQKGMHTLEWDGMDKFNEKVRDGEYRVEFTSITDKGVTIPVDVNKTATVERVDYADGEPLLIMGDKKMKLSEVQMVVMDDKPKEAAAAVNPDNFANMGPRPLTAG